MELHGKPWNSTMFPTHADTGHFLIFGSKQRSQETYTKELSWFIFTFIEDLEQVQNRIQCVLHTMNTSSLESKLTHGLMELLFVEFFHKRLCVIFVDAKTDLDPYERILRVSTSLHYDLIPTCFLHSDVYTNSRYPQKCLYSPEVDCNLLCAYRVFQLAP